MKRFITEFSEIDEKVMKIINRGLLFSFGVGILGVLFLLTYNTHFVTYDFYEGGFILIKTGLIFASQFIGCGFVVDKLIKNKV